MNRIFLAASLLFVLFLLPTAMGQNFDLNLYTKNIEEGGLIWFNFSVLNPSLASIVVEPVFIAPDGTEVPFLLPTQEEAVRRRFPSPIIPPVSGTINGSETGKLSNLMGETKFEWRTPFSGKVGKLKVDIEEKGNWTLKVSATAVDFGMNKTVTETFTAKFNITKIYSERNPKYIVFGLSILTSMFTTVATYFMVDQKKAKLIRDKVSAMQKEIMEAQKSGDKKKIAKAKKKQSEMMALQSDMMRNQFKPMIIYMIPLFAVFYFLRAQFDMVPVAELPFRLWFMDFFHQNNVISADQFGFIAWYFATASWFGSIFRKILGVV
jgi:uncharacterized membrane protein (DUF106 family)